MGLISLYIKSGMSRVNDKVSRGLEVPLRALRCKARGGGGRLRQATAREEKKLYIYIIVNIFYILSTIPY